LKGSFHNASLLYCWVRRKGEDFVFTLSIFGVPAQWTT
jgi:hypothetical protein